HKGIDHSIPSCTLLPHRQQLFDVSTSPSASCGTAPHGNINATSEARAALVSKVDRKNGVPSSVATIPLTDRQPKPTDPSIGDLTKEAATHVSPLVRAEVELARAELTRDVKKGLTGSVYFIAALVVLFYSTFFFFFFLAELLDTWLWRWFAFLIVFAIMV